MIIDFHTHIFPDKIAKTVIDGLAQRSGNIPNTDGTVDGLINHMQSSGVDIAVTLPVVTKPSQFESITRFALSVNEAFIDKKTRLISFASIHPQCEDIRGKMKFIADNGFLGVKIHPEYQDMFIDDEGYVEILKCAKDYDLIVVTHAGVDEGYAGFPIRCPPERALKVIEKVNHNKFVLGHYGANKQWEDVLKLLAGKDVYFDTAYMLKIINEPLFKEILAKHGEDRVLFATDCPWSNMKDDIARIKSFNLDASVYDKIFYLNAKKLLKL